MSGTRSPCSPTSMATRWALRRCAGRPRAARAPRRSSTSATACTAPRSARSGELLMAEGILSISGNQDRIVHRPPAGVEETQDYRFVRREITGRAVRLAGRPPRNPGPRRDLRLPRDAGLRRDLPPGGGDEHGVRLRSPEAILADLRGDRAAGGRLRPLARPAPRPSPIPGQIVVNPGSVGIPAYDHDQLLPARDGVRQPARPLRPAAPRSLPVGRSS